jgi:hypothetical protein
MTSTNIVTIPNQAFPNGNSDIKPEILTFIDRYHTFLRKTAESILGLAETLVQAEADLNGVDFLIFCDNVGIVKPSPTYSKLKQFGENSDRFRPFLDRLPNTWTTIYKLAKLEANEFARISNCLSPFITSKEIDEQMGVSRTTGAGQTYDFKIALGVLDGDSKAEVYEALLALKERFKFSLSEDRKVLDELKTIKLAKAA